MFGSQIKYLADQNWGHPEIRKPSNWHSLITFRYSSSAACILRRRRVHFFQSDCHYLWGILVGFTGVLRLRGVSCSNPADIETADISSLSLTSSHGRERQINLPIFIFPPLYFHGKKQYGILNFVLECLFFNSLVHELNFDLRQALDFLFWGIQSPSCWPER